MATYSKLRMTDRYLYKVIENIEVSDEIGNDEALGIQYCLQNYSDNNYWILNNNEYIIDPNYNMKNFSGEIDGYWLQRFNTFTPPYDSAEYVFEETKFGYNLYKNGIVSYIDSTNHLSFSDEDE